MFSLNYLTSGSANMSERVAYQFNGIELLYSIPSSEEHYSKCHLGCGNKEVAI